MSGQICPKCGHVRSLTEDVPDWQCPACGIAYHKYDSYLEKAKHIARPPPVETRHEPVLEDGSVWSLVGVNLAVLVLALLLGWRLIDMMLVFWIQSIIIGISNIFRMLALDKFSTENFTMNNRPVLPTSETKRQVAIFFAFHYGFFHFGYLIFLLSGTFGDPRLDWDIAICALAFAVNHVYSFRYHRDMDRQGTPNIGTLMFTPYARIVPMHLTIIFGAMAPQTFGLLLFGGLKTVADAIMHQVEHNTLSARAD